MYDVKIKAKLKERVTEEEFLMATFGIVSEEDIGKYDIHKMKTEDLEGLKDEVDKFLCVCIPYTDEDYYIDYEYDAECKSIWEIIK